MNENPVFDVERMSDGELEASLLIEEGAVEAYRYDSMRLSQVFWKAVENRQKILREMRRRKYDRAKQ